MPIYIYIDIFIQWNAVDTVTNGPKKLGRFNEVTVLTRVFFWEKKICLGFCQAAKKSGRITEVAVRRGFTVLGCEAWKKSSKSKEIILRLKNEWYISFVWSQVWILIYRKWSIYPYAGCSLRVYGENLSRAIQLFLHFLTKLDEQFTWETKSCLG